MNDGEERTSSFAAGVARKHRALLFIRARANNACPRDNGGMIATRINWNVVRLSSPWMIGAIEAVKCKTDTSLNFFSTNMIKAK